MKHVLLAFQHSDQPFVDQLVSSLKHPDLRLISNYSIAESGDFTDALRRQLSHIDATIVLLNTYGGQSGWVTNEVARYLRDPMHLVLPVLLQGYRENPLFSVLGDRNGLRFENIGVAGIVVAIHRALGIGLVEDGDNLGSLAEGPDRQRFELNEASAPTSVSNIADSMTKKKVKQAMMYDYDIWFKNHPAVISHAVPDGRIEVVAAIYHALDHALGVGSAEAGESLSLFAEGPDRQHFELNEFLALILVSDIVKAVINRQLTQDNPPVYLPDLALRLYTWRPEQAKQAHQNALKLCRQLAQDILANLYSDTQRLKQAKQAYQETLKINRQLAPDSRIIGLNPRNTLAQEKIAEKDILRVDPESRAGCFVPETTILMADSTTRQICELVPGDEIVGTTQYFDQRYPAVVKEVIRLSAERYIVINNRLQVTPSHPLLVNQQWTNAGELRLGDQLYHPDGSATRVQALTLKELGREVYNLVLDPPLGGFFAEEILVQNVTKRNMISAFEVLNNLQNAGLLTGNEAQVVQMFLLHWGKTSELE